ncbi:PREDICTED: sn1-specific diacylglycerol lipase beta-like [Acropora digitifera]|uniref:sn1-specific diacylglycerol lipase beta-like n=1 Tax=Acropora digitifera TaxID=70779 RepID=UPI00077A84BB|nr:PREDICTED: sn1-specific diacylglycerol lipase beta-like [Acropora digitifera]
MPGLVAFDRRWHIGSDDLFFPAAIGLVIRFCWYVIFKCINFQMWEKRCNWLCCCFAGRDHQYLSAVSDISEVLSAWFHDADVVASDIAVGLILLQQQQEQMQAEERSQPGESISTKGTPVNFNEPKEKGIVEDAYYFIKFALGSYGWPLYVYMNPCSGPWNLCGLISCCACCNPPPQHIHKDNCCQSNSTGLKLQTQLGDDDLIYCSYQDKIYEVPFYVAVDHLKRAVVVSIRGSMSLQVTRIIPPITDCDFASLSL